MNDYKWQRKCPPPFPKGQDPIADKGYDADWFSARLGRMQDHGLHSISGKPQDRHPT
ncbi:hypothetical protein [Rhizobium ruizarguesonis]|uniref:hypothetical protein n=1 Tax=Rhizobium ruizarguesonis TaxID=2081791 RepID=UPI0013EE8A50|nr:hypothetical protein [Rhizobium ruizarguesonis]